MRKSKAHFQQIIAELMNDIAEQDTETLRELLVHINRLLDLIEERLNRDDQSR
jgi:hypothetical protein